MSWQVRAEPLTTSKSMDMDMEMTSDREQVDSGDYPAISIGDDARPRTQPLEAKSVPPALTKFMEQIAGQLDILTQVSSATPLDLVVLTFFSTLGGYCVQAIQGEHLNTIFWAGIAQLVVLGLAVHSVAGSILLWGHFR